MEGFPLPALLHRPPLTDTDRVPDLDTVPEAHAQRATAQAVSAKDNGSLFEKMPSSPGAAHFPRTSASCVRNIHPPRPSRDNTHRAFLFQTHKSLVHPSLRPPTSYFGLLAPIPSHFSLKVPKPLASSYTSRSSHNLPET